MILLYKENNQLFGLIQRNDNETLEVCFVDVAANTTNYNEGNSKPQICMY